LSRNDIASAFRAICQPLSERRDGAATKLTPKLKFFCAVLIAIEGTIYGCIGTPSHVVERLIDHVSAIASDAEQIYDLHTYLPEIRKAMLACAAELMRNFAQDTAERRVA
jgi:hypothetical protein